jgi:hypothetical protein
MTEDQETTCYALSEDCLAPTPKPLTVGTFATLILEKVLHRNTKGLTLTCFVSITPPLVWFELTQDEQSINRYRDIEEAVKGWNELINA